MTGHPNSPISNDGHDVEINQPRGLKDAGLFHAASHGDHHAVEALLPFYDQHQRLLALCEAARCGWVRCVVALAANCGPVGCTKALSFAAHAGHEKCVAALIPLAKGQRRSSLALRLASIAGHTACVRRLIPVSNASASNSEALRRAAENGHSDCVRHLVPVSNLSAAFEEVVRQYEGRRRRKMDADEVRDVMTQVADHIDDSQLELAIEVASRCSVIQDVPRLHSVVVNRALRAAIPLASIENSTPRRRV